MPYEYPTTDEQFLDIVRVELSRARAKYPDFPRDIVHATAIMAEESGEAVRAALNAYYHGEDVELLRGELIQTAAMCVRVAVECLARMEQDEPYSQRRENGGEDAC